MIWTRTHSHETKWQSDWFAGKGFDTVMGAIGSNNERWGYFTVDLVIARIE